MAEPLSGTFPARPIAWGVGLSRNGKEQAEVTFELVDAGHAGQRKIWTGSFVGGAAPITIKALQACGFKGIDIEVLHKQPPPDVEVELVFEPEEYKGKLYEKIKYVNRPGGLRTTAMDDGQRAAFAERMRGVIAGMDAGQATAGAEETDDIPF